MNDWQWYQAALAASAKRFTAETKNHQMKILRDDGLYRHLRFRRPDSGFYWFDLVTWPGHLAVCGDFGTAYTFSRVEDMFTFFRATSGWNDKTINPQYWEEKIVSGKADTRTYDEDLFKRIAGEILNEYEAIHPQLVSDSDYTDAIAAWNAADPSERYPYGGVRRPAEPKDPVAAREDLKDADEDGETTYESGARRLLSQWETDGITADTGELKLTTWSWHYLWACNAIQWGIQQYDQAKAATATTEPVGATV